MSVLNRLMKNMKCLRKYYDLKQDELAGLIGVSRTAVTNYEKGTRSLDKDLSAGLSPLFMLSESELSHIDFGKLKPEHLKPSYITQKMAYSQLDTLFPITTSDIAMSNIYFRNAVDMHIELYTELSRINMMYFPRILRCIEVYESLFTNTRCRVESAANLTSLLLILKFITFTTSQMIDCNAIPLLRFASPDERVDILNDSTGYKRFIRNILKMCKSRGINTDINEYINIVVDSMIYSHLGHYFMAIQFIYDERDNGLPLSDNMRIGHEMLGRLAQAGNDYADRYLKIFEQF